MNRLSRPVAVLPLFRCLAAFRFLHQEVPRASTLDPRVFKPLQVVSVQVMNHNTRLIRLASNDNLLPNSLVFPVSSCLLLRPTGEQFRDTMKPYTPISHPNEIDHVDILVKRYPSGTTSSRLHELKAGDTLLVRGPIVKFEYFPNMWKKISMIAAGTGITPMYQLIQAILYNPADRTRISLMFGNKTEEDILLKNQLDLLSTRFSDRLSITYVLEQPPERWQGYVGKINEAVLKKALPDPKDEGHQVLVCGPPPMILSLCGTRSKSATGMLNTLGFRDEQVIKF